MRPRWAHRGRGNPGDLLANCLGELGELGDAPPALSQPLLLLATNDSGPCKLMAQVPHPDLVLDAQLAEPASGMPEHLGAGAAQPRLVRLGHQPKQPELLQGAPNDSG
eukprot:10099286-Lingulodinium_polyedra.AAC.1